MPAFPPSNPNDGTTLGTAEVIADEYVDPTMQAVRLEPLLPVTAYKLPRSKIAVGSYGVDAGDASITNPLPVESIQERQLHELDGLRHRDQVASSFGKLQAETITLADARGSHFSTRGQR